MKDNAKELDMRFRPCFPSRCLSRLGIWTTATWLLVSASARGDVDMSLVTVGDAGEPADANGHGYVEEDFRIGRFEVTNGQYVEFLNAVAASDPMELFHPAMSIARTGEEGSYLYSTLEEDKPICFVSWYDALRFTNWLHNGQPEGEQGPATTEDGAYTFGGPTEAGPRNEGARFFLPREDEWYKAAYYRGSAEEGYWRFPTQSDVHPTASAPAAGNSLANYDHATGGVSPVGSYPDSTGPYGTLDQAGNVWEWVETSIDGDQGIRGGSWDDYELLMDAWYRDGDEPETELEFIGFRVAAAPGVGAASFRRGFVNNDDAADMSDAISIFGFLFLGTTRPGCLSAADINDDNRLDLSDGVRLLIFLFNSGGTPPEPFAECGIDPTPDTLGCESFPRCP